MRREQFNQKHNGLAKEQQDMKWRVYQDELLYEAMRQEAIARSMAGGVGGGGPSTHYDELIFNSYVYANGGNPTADGTQWFFHGVFPGGSAFGFYTISDASDNYGFAKLDTPFTQEDINAIQTYIADNGSPPSFFYGRSGAPISGYELVYMPGSYEGQDVYFAVVPIGPATTVGVNFEYD